MQAFILAGGFATRLWPLTEKRAKPLLPLAGKALLTHLVEKIPEGMPVTVSTNAVFAEDFEKWRKELRSKNQELRTTILIEDAGHEDEKLGALGAVSKWISEEKIEDDVLLLAGDNYLGFSLEAFLRKYEQGIPLLAAYDIRERERAKGLGTVVMEGDVVRSFEEKPENPRSTLVSTGCFVLPTKTLPVLRAFAARHPDNIGGIFEHFLREGITVWGVVFEEPWFDIGSFEAYLEATKTLVGADTRRGVACYAPTEGPEGNVFHDSVVIGNRCNVRKSKLRNVVLFEECEINDCVLENCIVDNGCVLRGVDLTGKMLREGTRLLRK